MDMSKYLGILRWSLNYSDGTRDTDLKEMDPETRKWLREAMESQVVDPVDQMKALVKVLQIPRCSEREASQAGESNKAAADLSAEGGEAAAAPAGPEEGDYVQNKVDALIALQDWVEQIDWAADLHKIGGFTTVIQLMDAPEDEIRVHALEVFGTTVQNNPKPQEWALELGALPILVKRLEAGAGLSEDEQAKTLLALSSLIRESTPATVSFIKEHKGVALLLKVISGAEGAEFGIKAQRKALFLMRYVLETVPAVKIVLAEMLAQTLNVGALSQDIDVRENSLHLLVSVYKDPNSRSRVEDATLERTRAALAQYEPGASHFADLDEVSQDVAKSLLATLNAPPDLTADAEAPMMLGM